MKGHDQRWFAARRPHGRQHELRFAARTTRNGKFQRADAHGMQALRVGETEEIGGHSAVTSEPRGRSSNVPAGALNAASRKQARK